MRLLVVLFCAIGMAVGLVRIDSIVKPKRPTALPLIVTTWPMPGFQDATKKAWQTLERTGSRLQAVVDGCSECERLRCDGSVGWGGSPDERGETTLDALLMDGPRHRVAGVADLRRVRDAVRVAWAVMNFTKHTLIVGESATTFATEMGFHESDLHSSESATIYRKWRAVHCQPNYRKNVFPDPRSHCGPYSRSANESASNRLRHFRRLIGHDTIGMVVVDAAAHVAVATSTNGATHKVPGRVGDSPIAGAGGYADDSVGGAAATGDGDIMMRFLPSYQIVESMRNGMDPTSAAQDSIRRMARVYPNFRGGVIAANRQGEHGAACNGMPSFGYCVLSADDAQLRVHTVECERRR